MAIKNASDLLVYKKSPADVAQITRIKVLNATPLSANGTVKILNTTTSGGANVAELETAATTSNTGSDLIIKIFTLLVNNGYAGSSSVTEGDYVYRDFTNFHEGDVNTLSFADGTAEIDDGGIEVIVIQSGETLNGQEPIAHSTSASISFNNDLRDVTTKDSAGFQENALVDLRSFELSSDALQDINADLDFKEFYDDINERNEVISKICRT